MTTPTDLSIKMRARADADGLPATHKLREHADKFDAATAGYWATPQTVNTMQFMGAWSAPAASCSSISEPDSQSDA